MKESPTRASEVPQTELKNTSSKEQPCLLSKYVAGSVSTARDNTCSRDSDDIEGFEAIGSKSLAIPIL